MTIKLRQRQAEVYAYIFEATMRDGWQPSYREVAEHFGWRSMEAVVCHLEVLREMGYIEFPANKGRAIKFILTPEGRPFTGFVCKASSPEQDDGKGGMI